MASNHIQESPTAEVDPFESIESLLLNVEEKTLEKGLKEGEDISFHKHFTEGFALGLVKGYEVGSEITFYKVFAKTWLDLAKDDQPKEQKLLQQLLELAEQCPEFNSKEENSNLRQKLNAKFKQVCAVLKLNTRAIESNDTSW